LGPTFRSLPKIFEIFRSTDLAQLIGRVAEDGGDPAGVLIGFTEGFDTADLKAAKTLLDKLTEPAIAAEG
jgi:hypothetical protein